MTRSTVLVLGMLFAWALIWSHDVLAATEPGTDVVYASTDPIAFKFTNETVASGTSNEVTTFHGSTSEPAPDVVDDTLNRDSFAESEETVEVDDAEAVVFTADEDESNATLVGEDRFDEVEGSSSAEEAPEDGDFSLASTGCETGNPIDDCWRCDPNWAAHRQSLASCAIGFGLGAIGGKNGKTYVVTSARDDNPAAPAPGTLRYAVTRSGPLWIIFAHSMIIKLKNELMITSFKTIDGRGANVRITGAGLTIKEVSNVIVHGIAISDIKPTGPARIMTSTAHVGKRGKCDGDAISIFSSTNVWIDHCYLARAADGLVDVIRGSTAVSITNNYFTQHDKVMLLGAHATDTMDNGMYVTVAYNIFGPGLVQRMPRVRFGNVHVVNNDYTSGWSNYAIGGSEAPTILSQGNVFNPSKGKKQVTQRIDDGGPTYGGPKNWDWKSEGDQFLSGAFFSSAAMRWTSQSYAKTASATARPASMVARMVQGAGPLGCRLGVRC